MLLAIFGIQNVAYRVTGRNFIKASLSCKNDKSIIITPYASEVIKKCFLITEIREKENTVYT